MSLFLGETLIATGGIKTVGSGVEIGDMGFAPLGIDESLNLRRYLNGQVISQTQFVAFTAKVKSAVALFPNLGTTEANWQAEKLLSKFGQVGKFVIDDENQTIRLPAVVNAQSLLSLSGIGNLVNESLPNISGKWAGTLIEGRNPKAQGSGVFSGMVDTTSGSYFGGSFLNSPNWNISANGGEGYTQLDFNASLSSSTYQDNASVQQEAIQYPYYIQVATGVEETLPAIREYKVNNSDYFGKSMYSDIAPDNASYLASNGQYNARSVYPDYYDWLVSHIGETITANGGKVVLSTDTITDYDFVINTSDQTFRLPLLNGEEDLPSDRYDSLTYVSGQTYTAPANGWFMCGGSASSFYSLVFGVNSDASRTLMIPTGSVGYARGFGFVKKGETFYADPSDGVTPDEFRFIYAKGNGTLYYYVGDTVQDASLINAGAVLSTLSGKIGYDNLTTVHCVVETYQSGASWYRVYDDGWVEQGGQTSSGSWTSVSFLKPFRDTNYTLTVGSFDPNSNTALCVAAMTNKSASGVYLGNYYSGTPYGNVDWQACGYGA